MLGILGARRPLGRSATTFNTCVGIAGLGLLAYATASAGFGHPAPDLVAIFLMLFVAARLLRFEVPPNITASLIVPLQIASILLLGPVTTAWLALVAFFSEVIRERALVGLTPQRRRAMLAIIAFNLGMEALVTLAAGATWSSLRPSGVLDTSPLALAALLGTFLVFKTVNELLMAAGSWLRGVSLPVYVAGARTTVLIETLTLPLAALMVLVQQHLDRTAFYLFLLGVLLAALVVRSLTRARAELSAANADLRRKVREVETLSEIARAISADIELDSLLDTIYRRVDQTLKASHFFVALVDGHGSQLRIALEIEGGVRQEPKEIPLGAGLTSEVLRTRRPLLIRDLVAEKESLPVQPLVFDDRPNRTWVGVPMIARGELIGAMVLQDARPQAYDEDDMRMLSAIASQAAISVKNARLHQEALNALRVEAENRELKRLNAKKSDFVNMVAHQFRTPLSTVIGYANLLVERLHGRTSPADVPDLERHLRTVHSESRRLADMVEELLNLSRIRSGRLPLTFQRFDLGQLVREVLASHQLLADTRGQTLAADVDPGGEAVLVPGDSNFVRQALANVVSNAIKYAPAGSRVVVRARESGGHAVVEVVDEGPGLPHDELEKVFDEFYRGAPAQPGGTGLGLSICRGIVEAHGGRTWAQRRGAGTAFCLALPMTPAEHENGGAGEEEAVVPARVEGGHA